MAEPGETIEQQIEDEKNRRYLQDLKDSGIGNQYRYGPSGVPGPKGANGAPGDPNAVGNPYYANRPQQTNDVMVGPNGEVMYVDANGNWVGTNLPVGGDAANFIAKALGMDPWAATALVQRAQVDQQKFAHDLQTGSYGKVISSAGNGQYVIENADGTRAIVDKATAAKIPGVYAPDLEQADNERLYRVYRGNEASYQTTARQDLGGMTPQQYQQMLDDQQQKTTYANNAFDQSTFNPLGTPQFATAPPVPPGPGGGGDGDPGGGGGPPIVPGPGGGWGGPGGDGDGTGGAPPTLGGTGTGTWGQAQPTLPGMQATQAPPPQAAPPPTAQPPQPGGYTPGVYGAGSTLTGPPQQAPGTTPPAPQPPQPAAAPPAGQSFTGGPTAAPTGQPPTTGMGAPTATGQQADYQTGMYAPKPPTTAATGMGAPTGQAQSATGQTFGGGPDKKPPDGTGTSTGTWTNWQADQYAKQIANQRAITAFGLQMRSQQNRYTPGFDPNTVNGEIAGTH